ncbi:aminotransferase class III-fold pyridoxal phosphate-dependent enzyme [Rhodobacteraceae bacterium PA1-206B]
MRRPDGYLGSGALFLGHNHPVIQAALADQLSRGNHFFSYLNEQALELARRLVPLPPCAERIRFTTSGSEATLNALRLARAHTGRDKILKFEGTCHGNHDYAQHSTYPMASVNYPTPLPDTAGIPEAIRDLTREYGIVMIMDKVVTGLRYGLGGAGLFRHHPRPCDLRQDHRRRPAGRRGGRACRNHGPGRSPPQTPGRDLCLSERHVQGYPPGCAAALATLEVLDRPGLYEGVFATADRLRAGLQSVVDSHGIGLRVFGVGPTWHMAFAEKPPENWREFIASDLRGLAALEDGMNAEGIFLLPAARRFVSLAHDEADLEATFAAMDRACARFRAKRL